MIRLEKVMSVVAGCAVALTLTGCVEAPPEVAISEPDPELVFVRGYRGAADECHWSAKPRLRSISLTMRSIS